MSDNIQLNAGSGGPVLASKEVGGVQFQKGYDWDLDIAEGGLPGIDALLKFGAHFDVDSGATKELIWSPQVAWTPLTSASTLDVVSDSTNDTDGGTGARTVELIGLDSNWVEQTEEITLSGTTPVTTTKSWLRVFRMKVLTAGSTENNVGTLTATATTGATVQCNIKAAYGQSLTAYWTVPAGKTLYIRDWYCQIGRSLSAVATVGLFLRPDAAQADAPLQCKHLIELNSGGNSGSTYEFKPNGIAEQRSDVMCMVMECDTNNTILTAGFSGVYK